MEVLIDCIPCHIRQAINASKNLLDDKKKINETIEKILKKASRFNSFDTNFHLYVQINDILKEVTGGKDPYKDQKKEFNSICMELEKELKARIERSDKPFETAARIALAGNVIDVMQRLDHGTESIRASIDQAFAQKMDKDCFVELEDAINNAKKILYIGDNAGEIVFDKIFIEFIIENGIADKDNFYFAVRGGPTVNDVTIEDAKYVGLDKTVKITDTGAELPFAYLPFCSESFNDMYKSSDLVISKGMGNFEGLMKEKGKDIFFLLKIKCSPIQKIIGNGHSINDIVIIRSKGSF